MEDFVKASLRVKDILGVLEEKKNLGEASIMLNELLSFLSNCGAKSRVVESRDVESSDVVTLPPKRKRTEDNDDDKYPDCPMTKSTPRPKSTAGYGSRSIGQSEDQVRYYMRRRRGYIANQFLFGCTFDSVLKTCVQGPDRVYRCVDNSFGITWVAVQAMDNTIAVVTRQLDLDMAHVNKFRQTQPRKEVIAALHQALTSEVECLPYDDDDIFLEGPTKSIKKPFSVGRLIGESVKKPFSVVSVYPVPEKSDEEAGQQISSVEYDGDKAINFLMGKMDSELVATLDDAVKIAISGFKHLCRKDLKAEEYWVSKWDGKWDLLRHMSPVQIDECLEVISGKMTA